MKKITGLIAIFLFVTFLCFRAVQAAEPSLGSVNLSPAQPMKLSTITFTVRVIGDDIETANLWVKECNQSQGICENSPDNITMNLVEGSTYSVNITLNYPIASYLTYKVLVKSQGTWTTLPDIHGVNVTLSKNQGNGSTNGDDDKSPGFEFIVVLAAVGGIVIILGRKRFK